MNCPYCDNKVDHQVYPIGFDPKENKWVNEESTWCETCERELDSWDFEPDWDELGKEMRLMN
jgi:hypothetical protein